MASEGARAYSRGQGRIPLNLTTFYIVIFAAGDSGFELFRLKHDVQLAGKLHFSTDIVYSRKFTDIRAPGSYARVDDLKEWSSLSIPEIVRVAADQN